MKRMWLLLDVSQLRSCDAMTGNEAALRAGQTFLLLLFGAVHAALTSSSVLCCQDMAKRRSERNSERKHETLPRARCQDLII